MNLFSGIFIIFAVNLFNVFCNACNLSNSVCKLDNYTLNCNGSHDNSIDELPSFHEFYQNYHKITELSLKSVCLEAGDLDKFDSLKTLKFLKGSTQLLDEKIFTPKLGSTLFDLKLDGNYSFSISAFKHLKNLTSLIFIHNFKIESLLSKEFFSDSLSNVKTLQLSHSGISSFDGDMFVNLKNLEYLNIYVNNLKEFPKVIQYIPSLKMLGAGHQKNLKTLKTPFPQTMHNLESIWFTGIQILTSIENCAFCNFPNLKSIYFGYSYNLTWIHENAFGGLLPFSDDHWGYKLDNMEAFDIQGCNVSVLPERLLNWPKLKHIYLIENKFICNCSNAWLIEDIQSLNPAFSDKLQHTAFNSHTPHIKCHGPENAIGKLLNEISIESCKEMICEKTSKALWIFVGVFLTVLVMIIRTLIVFRQRIREFYEGLQSNIEHITLQEYTDS